MSPVASLMAVALMNPLNLRAFIEKEAMALSVSRAWNFSSGWFVFVRLPHKACSGKPSLSRHPQGKEPSCTKLADRERKPSRLECDEMLTSYLRSGLWDV